MSQRNNIVIALRIDQKYNEENIKPSKVREYRRARVLNKQTTTAAYADSLIFDKRLIRTVLMTIKETAAAQSIYYKVLACIDPEDWHEIQGETSLAAAGHVALTLSDSWAYLKLQIKNNSGAGVVSAFMSGLTP